MSSTVIVLWRCRIFLSVLYLHFILFLFFLLASFQAASIMQGSNGLQPPLNAIKIEAPSYYCNSYTPPGPDHSASMLQAGAYSKSETILVLLKDVFKMASIYQSGPLPLHRNSQSPIDPRGGNGHKRLRRMSSTEDDMDVVTASSGGGSSGTSSSIIIRGGGQGNDNNKGPSAADLSYYGQSPNSLSNQTSWHSEMDHGEIFLQLK